MNVQAPLQLEAEGSVGVQQPLDLFVRQDAVAIVVGFLKDTPRPLANDIGKEVLRGVCQQLDTCAELLHLLLQRCSVVLRVRGGHGLVLAEEALNVRLQLLQADDAVVVGVKVFEKILGMEDATRAERM